MSNSQRDGSHTTLAIAVLGAEHVPRHTDRRVKIPGGVRGSCDLFKVQQALCQLHCMFHRLLPFWRVWQNWRFYLWGVFTFVFEVDVELKREQPPAPTARSESKSVASARDERAERKIIRTHLLVWPGP